LIPAVGAFIEDDFSIIIGGEEFHLPFALRAGSGERDGHFSGPRIGFVLRGSYSVDIPPWTKPWLRTKSPDQKCIEELFRQEARGPQEFASVQRILGVG
jgi:hypothetical protein